LNRKSWHANYHEVVRKKKNKEKNYASRNKESCVKRIKQLKELFIIDFINEVYQ